MVLSSGAATGIDARPDAHFLIAEDDASFADAMLQISDEPGHARSMGKKARRFVLDNMSWPAMLADLPHVLGMEPGNRRDAA